MQHDILTEPQGDGAGHGNGLSDAASAAGNVVGSEASGAMALPPLTVSALMVTKADLMAALRVYLPHLSDIEMIDSDRFLLSVSAPSAEERG